jgi:hypothetical protein
MREMFAYSCEAFSRIAANASGGRERIALASKLKTLPTPCEDYVDSETYFSILDEAAQSRNGWKVILNRCSVKRNKQPHSAIG